MTPTDAMPTDIPTTRAVHVIELAGEMFSPTPWVAKNREFPRGARIEDANGLTVVTPPGDYNTPGSDCEAIAASVNFIRDDLPALLEERERLLAKIKAMLCEDCPPVGYPTDETRCESCPRRSALTPRGSK